MSKQVLLIDDDQVWLRRAALTLQNAGYSVLEALNASEAMQKADGAELGLIVLDLNLAGESGLMLMKFLKRNHPEVPILLCTGMDHDDSTIRAMLDLGADQYLHKSSAEEFLVTVSTYFKQWS
jgi:DNA-binding response OmpR family regulator